MMASRLIDWIERTDTPPLPWVGSASGRIANPPAHHIEILYVPDGGFPHLMIGDRDCAIPPGFVAIYSVHLGNYAAALESDLPAWGLFFDVSHTVLFRDLERVPFFACVPATRPERLKEAIVQIQQQCASFFGSGWGYPYGRFAYPGEAGSALRRSHRIFIKSSVLELLAGILEEGELAGEAVRELPRGLAQAIAHISQHYADAELFLGALAQSGNFSEDHLGRLFRAHLGIAPMQYLQRFRIEKSCFLLKHTDLYVEEIAGQVGFRDAFYFSRIFRKHIGISPSEYRQKRESNAP